MIIFTEARSPPIPKQKSISESQSQKITLKDLNTKTMPHVNLSSLFASTQHSWFVSILRKHPENIIKSDSKRIKAVITPELVKNESEKELYSKFIEAVGITEPINNYGVATYERATNLGVSHVPVWLGKEAETSKIGLLIGAETSTEGIQTNSVFVPITVTGTEKKGKTVYEYSIGESKIELTESQQDNKTYYGLVLKYDDGDDTYTFSLPNLIKKELKESGQIKQLFRSGRLDEAVKDFSSGGSAVFLRAADAFYEHFLAKTFPEDGVFLLATDGRMSVIPAHIWNSSSDIITSQWRILAVSHPEMEVTYKIKNKATNKKEAFVDVLENAYSIQFSSASKNNEAFNFFVDNIDGIHFDRSVDKQGISSLSYSGMVLINIVGANNNIAQNPKNAIHFTPEDILDTLTIHCPQLIPVFEASYKIASQPSNSATTSEQAKSDLVTAPNSFNQPESGQEYDPLAQFSEKNLINKSVPVDSVDSTAPVPDVDSNFIEDRIPF